MNIVFRQYSEYHTVGKFQFLRIGDLYRFTGLIFADVHDHAHYTLYNRAYFVSLIFAVSRSSVKTANIGPHYMVVNCHRLCVYVCVLMYGVEGFITGAGGHWGGIHPLV